MFAIVESLIEIMFACDETSNVNLRIWDFPTQHEPCLVEEHDVIFRAWRVCGAVEMAPGA